MYPLLLLVLLPCGLAANQVYPKCCDSVSVLTKNDSSYTCIPDLNKRTQIVVNETNFQSFGTGLCVEMENSIGLFEINSSGIVKVRQLEENIFPKCCPVGFAYNTTTHGCFELKKKVDKFFEENYVQVGLPQCKIIVDVKINDLVSVERLNRSAQVFADESVAAEDLYCVDKDQDDLFVMRICYSDYNICEKIKCVHKCCPDGQSFINGAKCFNTFRHGLDLSAFSDVMDDINGSFAVVHGHSIHIYPLSLPRFTYHLDATGTFTMKELDEGKVNVTKTYNSDEEVYCVEHAMKKNFNNYSFFRGFPPQSQLKFLYTRLAMAISCFFLVLTILYYCFSGEKHTLFGKTLISFCLSSLMAFVLFCYMAFDYTRPKPGSLICPVLTFLLTYSTFATFTWMNIMCIDIYCTFGSSKSFSDRQQRGKDLKRFLLYTSYGWGCPVILTAIPLIFYHVDVPFAIKLIVNQQKCWFYRGEGNYAQILFLMIPLAILQICNLILFIKTAIYCLQVKREISKMNDTNMMKGERRRKFNNFQDRFGLLMKLFLIMGISFLFEVVSIFYNFKQNSTMKIIETIWDTFNSLQGLFIFLIFVFKKRILKKFGKKVGLSKLRKFSFISSATTQTTSIAGSSKQEKL